MKITSKTTIVPSPQATGHPSLKLAYTATETCQLLGISPRSLRRLEARHAIRSSKALRKKLFPATEIVRFLEETL